MSEFAEGYAIGADRNNSNCCYPMYPAYSMPWGMGMGGFGGGFGFGGAWGGDLLAIIVLAALFGNGGWGFGGNGGGCYHGACATQADVRSAVDQQTLISKIDQQTYGIADTFNSLNNTINSNFRGVDNAICNLGYQNAQLANGITTQLAECCCTTQRAIDGVNFNISTQFGNLNSTLCGLGRDIIENQNANYRALHDEIVANKIEAKNEKISELEYKLYRADLAASQAKQNEYLVQRLDPHPCPTAAYVVQPPQQVTFPTNCCGQFNGYNNGCY